MKSYLIVCVIAIVATCALAEDRCTKCVSDTDELKPKLEDPNFVQKWRKSVLSKSCHDIDEPSVERCLKIVESNFDANVTYIREHSSRDWCEHIHLCEESEVSTPETTFGNFMNSVKSSDNYPQLSSGDDICNECLENVAYAKEHINDPQFIKQLLDQCQNFPRSVQLKCIDEFRKMIEFIKTHSPKETCVTYKMCAD